MNDSGLTSEHDILDSVASRMKLLAEPMRLRLLTLLREKERCVKELVEHTGAGQANISKHLSLLHMKGVISRRKEGLFVYYYVSDHSIFDAVECVRATLEKK